LIDSYNRNQEDILFLNFVLK